MFFDTKQKILFGVVVFCFLFAGAATVARNYRNSQSLPADTQKVIPLEKPTNIELYEDDAGVVP